MTKEDFYRKLTGALLGQAFQFEANGLSRDEVTKDRDVLTSFTRKATQFVPPVLGKIHTVFDEHVVQQSLDKLRQAAPIVCFKYVLSQPVLVAVVEADGIADEKAIEFACLFDSVVLEMLNVTGKMGGIKVGGLHLGGTKLSATGITLHVFFDQASASTFAEHTQQKCKIRDLPPKFHPAAVRVLLGCTPTGAGGATGDRRSWSGLRSRSPVAVRMAA